MNHNNTNTRFCATLNDGSFINITANFMEVRENLLYVWDGDALVGLVEMSAVIAARLEEKVR